MGVSVSVSGVSALIKRFFLIISERLRPSLSLQTASGSDKKS